MSLTDLFEKKLQSYTANGQEAPAFHNEKRLRESLATVEEMALSDVEKTQVQAALWLYFLGFYENPADPRAGSLSLTAPDGDLREAVGMDAVALLQTISKKRPPESAAEAAFQDAATMHFAGPKFLKRLKQLWKEQKATGQKTGKVDWYRTQLLHLETHRFFTPFAQQNWQNQKLDNLTALQKEIKKMDKQLDAALMQELQVDSGQLKNLKKKLAKVEGHPERGVETWFRTASRNLYTRRQIVDTKSNLMITMNAIIISVMLGNVYPQLNDNPHLIWAITPMILTNVLSIAFAIFATRPELASGIFTKAEVEAKTARLTTFDDFYQVPLADYEWAVKEMLEDRDFLYDTLIRDMHRLGIDLTKRYKNIRLSYQIFLMGLIVSLMSFGSCYLIF